MTRSRLVSSLVLLASSPALLFLVAACGPRGAQHHLAGQPGALGAPHEAPRPVVDFPTEAALEGIVAQAPAPSPRAPGERARVAVSAWDLAEAPAPGDPPYEGGPLHGALSRIATAEGIAMHASASLRCAARELARFQLDNDGPPSSRLTRHILSACGSAAQSVSTLAMSGPAASDAALGERFGAQMTSSLRRGLSTGSWVGVGVARRRGTAFVVVAFAEPPLRIEPFSSPGPDGRVELRGTLRQAGDRLSAVMTDGAFGQRSCTKNPSVRAPAFAFSCLMAASDTSARVEVLHTSANSIRQRVLSSLIVQRDASAALPFVGAPAEEREPTSAAAVLEYINAQRTAAGLGVLTLAEAESAQHQRYAPALFGLSEVGGADSTNTLLLGMAAGWRVDGGLIRDATSVWMLEQGEHSAADVVGALLETPSGRLALLSPDARQLAVGLFEDESDGKLGVTLTTYAFFEGVDHAADAERVIAQLSALRRLRGLGDVQRLGTLPALDERGAAVSHGGVWPSVALQEGIDRESQRLRIPLRASQIESVTLDELPFPTDALNSVNLAAEAVVTHTHAEGAAWGQYVVYLVMR